MAGLGTIVRRRLIEPYVNAPVLDIQAPSGYGKSILSEQLIAAWELPPLRVQLRAETVPEDLVDQLRRAARRTGLSDVASLFTGERASDALDGVVTFCAAGGFDLAVLIDDAQMLSDEAFEHLSGLPVRRSRCIPGISCRAMCSTTGRPRHASAC